MKLIRSPEYQNMNINERNKRLGKELVACLPLALAMGSYSLYFQYKWRKDGTSNALREAIENYI